MPSYWISPQNSVCTSLLVQCSLTCALDTSNVYFADSLATIVSEPVLLETHYIPRAISLAVRSKESFEGAQTLCKIS
jgi:hypothetical protein